AFQAPIAPHIAAANSGISFDIASICRQITAISADIRIVEGVGGWMVPLGPGHTLADLPAGLKCPVILVVGMRLGCLNHALLSARAIAADGIELAGWIANFIEPDFAEAEANLATLVERIDAPLLGNCIAGPAPQTEQARNSSKMNPPSLEFSDTLAALSQPNPES
ncbi:MAG: dethiobiotin synthase, partial [Wenzhouxiangellaceae bacterium]|nr:dethiobiotin synthase [Wenzhouxiangellaceae bacterium]